MLRGHPRSDPTSLTGTLSARGGPCARLLSSDHRRIGHWLDDRATCGVVLVPPQAPFDLLSEECSAGNWPNTIPPSDRTLWLSKEMSLPVLDSQGNTLENSYGATLHRETRFDDLLRVASPCTLGVLGTQ